MVDEAATAVPGTEARAAERQLILSYAPAAVRDGIAALLALDDTLADVPRRASEPMIVQMRLTWWHDALIRLDDAPPPAQPALTALADTVLPAGVPGASLATLVEGWEALLDGDPGDPAMHARFGEARGGALFALAARLIRADDPRVRQAGAGWALADLSRSLTDEAAARAAASEAAAALGPALAGRWPPALRMLGALAHRARMDLAAPRDLPLPAATPGRVARLAWHRMTGR